jgi:hypothetical protein
MMLNDVLVDLPAVLFSRELDRQQRELAVDEARYRETVAFLTQQEADFPDVAPLCQDIRDAAGRLLDQRREALGAAVADFLEQNPPTIH